MPAKKLKKKDYRKERVVEQTRWRTRNRHILLDRGTSSTAMIVTTGGEGKELWSIKITELE